MWMMMMYDAATLNVIVDNSDRLIEISTSLFLHFMRLTLSPFEAVIFDNSSN